MPGVPGRHVTFLVSPRNVTQRRRPEGRVLRCATDSLRFSLETAAAELALPLQASTQTVLADYPVSSCDARRDLREFGPWWRERSAQIKPPRFESHALQANSKAVTCNPGREQSKRSALHRMADAKRRNVCRSAGCAALRPRPAHCLYQTPRFYSLPCKPIPERATG